MLLLLVYLLAHASVSHRRSSLQQEGWQRWAQSKAACLVASLSLQQAPFWHRRRPPPRRVPMLARDLSSQLACAMCVCVSALSRVSTDAQQRAAIDREPQYKSNRGSAVCHSAAKHATNLSEFVQGPRWSDSKMFSAERVSTEGDGCVRLG